MELRDYLAVLLRRWWLVALVPVLVLAVTLYQSARASTTYTATARLAVTRLPEEDPSPTFKYDEYYNFLASEYILDDFVEIVRGNVFASDVAKTIAADRGVQVSPGEVQGAISASRVHRILTIDATSATPERAEIIAQAAAKTLEEKGTSYYGFDSPQRSAVIHTIQQPSGAAPNTSRQEVLLALEVLSGLFAGVLLAFIVDYFDDTLRTPEMVSAALGVPVVARVPDGRER